MMDAGAKQRVKDALRARVEAELGSSRRAVSGERSASALDRESSYSVDDVSQSDEDGELAGLLEEAGQRRETALAGIGQLDFRPRDTVAPGAIVAFGGRHYVVGMVADEFECDGTTYEGISSDSPVYARISGLHAGDTFAFDGHEHRIDLVT
ncbi:MAG: hypothetical protein ACRDPH_10340 [Marmoricola sp.]